VVVGTPIDAVESDSSEFEVEAKKWFSEALKSNPSSIEL